MLQPSWPASPLAWSAIVLCLAGAVQSRGFPNLLPHAKRPSTVQVSAPYAEPAVSDLAPDPAMRLGTLDNGLRFAIMRVAGAQASLRLRLDAGSLMEATGEQGFAQLLARLAFDGGKPSPGGLPSDVAKAHGLAFTADDNTVSNPDGTTFMLEVPSPDSRSLDVALTLLRAAVGAPRLAQADVDREWGVVLAHEGASNDIANRIFKARLAFLMEGQRPARSYLAGGAQLPNKVRRGPLADFHDRFYRPERAVLLVVGDIDVDAVDARIHARFADWRGAGRPGAAPDMGAVERRGLQARLLVTADAPAMLQLSWLSAPDGEADSLARRRRELVARLALAVLNRRLDARSQARDSPLSSAAAFQDEQFGAARVTGLLIYPQPDRWREALAAADQVLRAALTQPVSEDDLAAAREGVGTDIKERADTAADRSTSTIADSAAGSLAAGQTPTSPGQDLALFEHTADAVTTDDIATWLRTAFAGQGPLLFMSSPTAVDGGESTLAGAYAADQAAPIPPATVQQPLPAAYRDFGEAGKQSGRKDVIDLDTVFVRFENGVRLTIKPTKFQPGEVSVRVRAPGGMGAAQAEPSGWTWALTSLVDGSSATVSLGGDAIALSAQAERDDLEAELRTLAPPLIDPPWRADAFERARTAEIALLDRGDRASIGVERARVVSETLADARRAIEPLLTHGPLEVLIVGDVTVEKAIDAVADTFGALPSRPPVVTHTAPPTVEGDADDLEPREAGVAAVLRTLLQARLTGPNAIDQDAAIEELATRGVSRDELDRTKAELLNAEDTARRTNEHWLDLLAGAQDKPDRLSLIRSHDASIARVTAADIREAAARYPRRGAPAKSSPSRGAHGSP